VARPKDQERRRRELVAAAHTAVAEKGLAAVKLRDVAEAAGLTPGAVLYYYDGLDDLFFAAYERAVERFCAEREAAVAQHHDPLRQLGTAVRLGVPTGRDDAEIRLLYEFEAVAFRSQPCADLMWAYVERQVDMYEAILKAAAVPAARRAAANIVALEDGHGVYVLTGHMTPRDLERLLVQHVAQVCGVEPRRLGRLRLADSLSG
jgi:AcrR family transcriptional regulator